MKRNRLFQLYNLEENQYSLRGLWLFVQLYFGSLLFAALVAPVVYWMFQDANFDPNGYMNHLAEKPFGDFFKRGRQLSILILFPILMKKANLFSLKRLGYLPPAKRDFGRWFLIGIVSMGIVYAVDLSFGILDAHENWTLGRQFERVAIGLFASVLIGLLEETFFRGLVFRMFYTAFRPRVALIVSSLVFAYLHFDKVPDSVLAHVVPADIGFDDGFHAVWATMTAFTTEFEFLQFFNLFLVGIVLHQTFLLTGNLWACVGLHAGWVTMIQSFLKTFNENGVNAFAGTEKVVDGYLVTILLLIMVSGLAWFLKKRSAELEV